VNVAERSGQRRLVVFRHAKADSPPDVADHERPLSRRGHRDAAAAGRWLADHVGRPDVVVCSTAVRARQTWDSAAAAFTGDPPPVQGERRIYEADVDDLVGVLRELPAEVGTAVIVGHNPGMERLVQELTGQAQQLETAALAVLESADDWVELAAGSARLRQLAVPRG